jgi:hypothetical protein
VIEAAKIRLFDRWRRGWGAVWTWILHRPEGSEDHWLTRFVFLRLLGLVYLAAFLSLAQQLVPLIGRDGLLPARFYLERLRPGLAAPWLEHPTLFWISSSDGFMVALAWVGVALSVPLLAGFANALHLGVLWALYLSLVNVGQIWMGYGWESQLLETGFLAIFLCPLLDPRPFPRRPTPLPVVWLLRWLVFRIMLGAGLIKLRGDLCWRDLTCLSYYFETQPIPNPLSRYFHFAPHGVHVLGCLANHAAELVVPFFVAGPPRLRRIAGGILVAFQGMLILSGNLSFLNWLTIAPCLACFDDGVWRRVLPRRLTAIADRAKAGAVPTQAQRVTSWVLVALVAVLSLEPVANMLSRRQIMNTSFNPFRLVNTYGAFGSVGRERHEIILEGTRDSVISEETPWRAYEWKAKPGDPDRSPPILSPYHLRLDWQIWFAAMSRPERHPWVVHLVWKLLHQDEGALSLLANRPFPEGPPRYIRATLYRYRFTRPFSGERGTWSRERLRPWILPVSLEQRGLREFLVDWGFLREE